MDHLLRSLAPISDDGWKLLDEEARARLAPALGARRLVDFAGPRGWRHSATDLGRVEPVADGPAGVGGQRRTVLPLIEARVAFELSRAELRAGDRGADDVDLGPLDSAAHRLASAENAAVFGGWKEAFAGIAATSPHERLMLGSAASFPEAIAVGISQLLESGVSGPYGLALGPEAYRQVIAGTEGGFPLATHLREMLDGPLVWTPGVDGGALVSLRGGDFLFESGQDISLGYESHDAATVRLYLEESFSFHVATPEAAVLLDAAG